MSINRQNGSCLCGSVRFEIIGVFESFFLCHCEYCQKDTGSAHAANLFSTNARVRWISGAENIQIFRLQETRHVKSFCLTCGSALPTVELGGNLVVVPAGSLEGDVELRPTAHIFCSSKANWDTELEDIPRFDKLPS